MLYKPNDCEFNVCNSRCQEKYYNAKLANRRFIDNVRNTLSFNRVLMLLKIALDWIEHGVLLLSSIDGCINYKTITLITSDSEYTHEFTLTSSLLVVSHAFEKLPLDRASQKKSHEKKTQHKTGSSGSL